MVMSYGHSFLGCCPERSAASLSGFPPRRSTTGLGRRSSPLRCRASARNCSPLGRPGTLRVVAWLRSPKVDGQVRGTPMTQVRAALQNSQGAKSTYGMTLANHPVRCWWKRTGKIIVRTGSEASSLNVQASSQVCSICWPHSVTVPPSTPIFVGPDHCFVSFQENAQANHTFKKPGLHL